MIRFVVLLAMLSVSFLLNAKISSSDFNKCKNIQSSSKRLSCFDNIKPIKNNTEKGERSVSEKINASQPKIETSPFALPSTNKNNSELSQQFSTQTSKGNWQVHVDVINEDNYDDNTATATLLASSNNVSTTFQPILKIHCNSNKTDLSVNWGQAIGKIRSTTLIAGENKIPSSKWVRSNNKKIVYYPSSALYLIKQITDFDRFEITLSLRKAPGMTASFDITGIKNAIKPIRSTCGW